MSNRRSVFSFIKSNRRKVAGLLALALALGAWTAIGGPFSKEASSDDIPLHDGDVLVDSLNVSEENDKAENKVGRIVSGHVRRRIRTWRTAIHISRNCEPPWIWTGTR